MSTLRAEEQVFTAILDAVEECAGLCEQRAEAFRMLASKNKNPSYEHAAEGAQACADVIREMYGALSRET